MSAKKDDEKNIPQEDKKSGINAEEIIKKAQDIINDVILPKLKELFAISKAAAKGAIKGVKEMNKNKDDTEKK